MQKKYKMTGCARFFIALIIIAPLAYLGASYYNGQDGIQNIKNFLGIGSEKTESTSRSPEDKDKTIRRLEDENDRLKKEIESLKKEIDDLKKSGQ